MSSETTPISASLASYYGVTAVCAVNDHDTRSGFSEMGANLWICAPSNDLTDLHQGILTTENNDRYFEEFGGTSAATPIVSGRGGPVARRESGPDVAGLEADTRGHRPEERPRQRRLGRWGAQVRDRLLLGPLSLQPSTASGWSTPGPRSTWLRDG